jgi:hypothetical protein
MIVLIVMLWVALFTMAAVVDKRWPDRLSRRGRRLAGMPELPEGGPCLPPDRRRGTDERIAIAHLLPERCS